MMRPVYISSSAAISPQNSFECSLFLKEINCTTQKKLFVQEPDYRQYINPVAIRRMSRLIKMGIACGMKALQNAVVTMPDAIITGTGLGSMTDMEKFLKDMIVLKEEALNPTFFIQSTYNSVNGWLSLQTKATGYNQTFVHRGFSTEMALLDAQLLLNETDEKKNVLVGGFDEMTDEYFLVKSKVNYWKKDPIDSLTLLQNNKTDGTIGGEGAAFFVLSNEKEQALCKLASIRMIQEPNAQKIQEQIETILTAHRLKAEDIDVVISGRNGDLRFENLYDEGFAYLSAGTSEICFKHLTGEYPTATSFAVWLATYLFEKQKTPDVLIYKKGTVKSFKNILIINHYILNTASIVLLQKA